MDHQISEIRYAILTHPHFDHFSGFNDLLEYCLKTDIQVKYFLHTAKIVPKYIRMALKTSVAQTELMSLFEKLRLIRDLSGTVVGGIGPAPNGFPLYEGWTLEFLSPTSIEEDKFIRGAKYSSIEDEEGDFGNPNGNWLSTISKISRGDKYALLCSDVEAEVLSQTGKHADRKLVGKLVLCQIPHHGARKNHNAIFWQKLKRNPNVSAVVSVGQNSYGHPSTRVVDFFNKSGYTLYSTNDVGSLKSVSLSTAGATASSSLDVFSTLARRAGIGRYFGEKSFDLNSL